jgi:hypothetical protein
MRLGYYGILIIFVAFFLLLVLSPNLSCFGKKLRSPFYPLLRRKKAKKKIKAEDYGFSLIGAKDRERVEKKKSEIAAQRKDSSPVKDGKKKLPEVKKKRLKTDDYGFSLDDDDKSNVGH